MKRKILTVVIVAMFTFASVTACSSDEKGEENDVSAFGFDNMFGGDSGTSGDAGSSDTGTTSTKFDIEVNYSEKEQLSLTKAQLSSYSNVIKLADESVTITESGEYVIEGTLNEGQLIVDVPETDAEVVTLILNGVDITCSNSSAIYVKSADKVVLSLVEGTVNNLQDGSEYTYDDETEEEPNACVFSKDDLVISGKGTLNVTGKFNNGIASKDDLTITGGIINVQAVNNGIKGKDSIAVMNVDMTVQAGADGLKADNTTDAEKGFILIDEGSFKITAGEDAIQAETCMEINGGTFDIVSGDDGVHADNTLVINGGEINITQCYEGIEATYITMNDGDVHVVSADDGFNAAGGNDASAMGQRPGMNGFSEGTGSLTINGGYVYIDSTGDGLDANGTFEMTDGYVIVDGPSNSGNGAFDYGSSCNVTGGFIVAVGASGMAQMPNQASINCVMIGLSQTISSGTLVNISDSNGNTILTFEGAKSYNNMVLCTSDLKTGEAYTVKTGGSVTGTSTDGVYTGIYSGGTEALTFTIENTISTAGNANGGMGGMGGMKPGGNKGGGDFGGGRH